MGSLVNFVVSLGPGGAVISFADPNLETCVREATVLGMLGVVSLGYWIQDARAKQYYDEMILLVAVGAAIVLVADLASALARRYVRDDARQATPVRRRGS